MVHFSGLALTVLLVAQGTYVKAAALPQTSEKGDDTQFQEGLGKSQDTAVTELEKLKHLVDSDHNGKSVEMSKSQSSVISQENGKFYEHHDMKEFINEDGKLVAKVHQHADTSGAANEKPHEHVSVELDVPSEGIHHSLEHDSDKDGQKEIAKSFPGAARLLQPTGEALSQPLPYMSSQEITENGNRRAFNADITQEENNNMDHYSAYSGIQYSPLDMAEYIFWTGDEKGVTLAIEEFLQEGLMSREEAIAFLQEIKYNIEYLQAHYVQQRLKSAVDQRMQQENSQIKEVQMQLEKNQHNYQQPEMDKLIPAMSPFGKFNHDKILKALTTNTYERSNSISPATLEQLAMTLPDFRQDIYKKNVQDNSIQTGYKYLPGNGGFDQYEREPSQNLAEEEYEDLLERLRVADFLYTEYSLEEIIYQLAKVMFTQSLSRGSIEAQVALQKFTNFMEGESEQGRISKALEKKVLDVLVEALTDTLTERPDLITAARDGLGSGAPASTNNKMLQQLLEQGSLPKAQGPQPNKNVQALLKMNHQQPWVKQPQEHAAGENTAKIHPIQPVKRFRMAG